MGSSASFQIKISLLWLLIFQHNLAKIRHFIDRKTCAQMTPDAGSKSNRSSLNLLLFDFNHKKHQNCQIRGALNLTSNVNSSCAMTFFKDHIKHRNCRTSQKDFFQLIQLKVNPNSILQFSAGTRTCTKSPQYHVACLLASSFNFVKLYFQKKLVQWSLFFREEDILESTLYFFYWQNC